MALTCKKDKFVKWQQGLHTESCFNSWFLDCKMRPTKKCSHAYILIVRMYTRSSPIFRTLHPMQFIRLNPKKKEKKNEQVHVMEKKEQAGFNTEHKDGQKKKIIAERRTLNRLKGYHQCQHPVSSDQSGETQIGDVGTNAYSCNWRQRITFHLSPSSLSHLMHWFSVQWHDSLPKIAVAFVRFKQKKNGHFSPDYHAKGINHKTKKWSTQ